MDSSVPAAQRRTFLKVVLGGAGVVLAVMASWPLLRFLSPQKGVGDAATVVIDKGAVDVGGAHLFSFQGRSAVLLQNVPGEFVAFSAVCTHLGCVVQWLPEKKEFLCPCHAGRFSSDGQVIAGPPPGPLESIPVTLSGEQIIVG